MDIGALKLILKGILPQVIQSSVPELRETVVKVSPLDDAGERQVLKGLEDILIGKAEKIAKVDLDGDGVVGSVTFND